MAQFVITCPTTGKDVPIGIGGDRQSLEGNRSGFTNNSIQCPHCGQMHRWNGKDAKIVD